MSDEIRINGIAHSWGSVKLKIAGERYYGISSISYSDKLETTFGYGMGRSHKPRAQSRGKYSAEQIVMKVMADTAKEIRASLRRRSGTSSYGMVEVPIVLEYVEPDKDPVIVEFERCRLVEVGSSNEEGADVLTEELKWSTFGILRDGGSLFDEEN